MPEGEIKEALKNEGYSHEDIDLAFAPHHYDMRSWYLFFGIALLLTGIYFFFVQRSLFFLVLSALLFASYFAEIRRLQNRRKNSQ